MNFKNLLGAFLLAATAAVAAAEEYTDSQLMAKFYYDLGPDAVDVAKYPPAMQESYQAFVKACSQCHTLARAINAPTADKKDWRRFVRRMHVQTGTRPGTKIGPEDAAKIVDFLAYDSKVRKLDGKAAFATLTEGLKADFKNVQAERARLQSEGDAKNARPYDDHAGATPHPQ